MNRARIPAIILIAIIALSSVFAAGDLNKNGIIVVNATGLQVLGTGNFTGQVHLGNSKCSSGSYLTTDLTTGLVSCGTPSGSGNTTGSGSGTGVAGNISYWATYSHLNSSNMYYSGGNIGIGTTSPGAKLDVAGQIYADQYVVIHNNSGAEGGELTLQAPSGYPNWGIDSYNQLLRFYNSSDVHMSIDGLTGRVGIGTMAPAATLHVVGTLNATSTIMQANTPVALVGNCSAGQVVMNITNSGVQCVTPSGSSGNVTGAGAAGNVTYWHNGSQINSSNMYYNTGNIGIGTTTPLQKLDVNGSIRVQTIDAAAASGAGLEIKFGDVGSTGTSKGVIFAYNRSSTSTHPLILNHPGGNVGIGTATPSHTLHVNGTANISSTMYTDVIQMGASDYITSFADNNNYIMPFEIATGRMVLRTGGSDRLSVLYTGNVGIGTTSPSALLHINSSANAGSLLVQNTTGSTHIFVNGSSGYVGIGTAIPYGTLEIGNCSVAMSTYRTKSVGAGLCPQTLTGTATNDRGMIIGPESRGSGNGMGGVAIIPVIGPIGNPSIIYGILHIPTIVNNTVNSSNITTYYNEFSRTTLGAGYTGNITNAYTLYIETPTNSSPATITNAYGIYINSMNTSSATNLTRNAYGIYQAGTTDINYFAGNVGVGTTAPSAKLHVNHTSSTSNESNNGTSIALLHTGGASGTGAVVKQQGLLVNTMTRGSHTGTGDTYNVIGANISTIISNTLPEDANNHYLYGYGLNTNMVFNGSMVDPEGSQEAYLYGIYNAVRTNISSGGGEATTQGIYSEVKGSSNTIYGIQSYVYANASTMYGAYLSSTNNISGTHYGTVINAQGGGDIIGMSVSATSGSTSNYALMLTSSGTNSYDVYASSTGSKNYFAGKVGLNTTAPSHLLHVNGTANISGALYLGNSACTGSQVLTTNSAGLVSCTTPSGSGSGNVTGAGAAGNISYWNNGTHLNTSNMYYSGGNIGVGTTATTLGRLSLTTNTSDSLAFLHTAFNNGVYAIDLGPYSSGSITRSIIQMRSNDSWTVKISLDTVADTYFMNTGNVGIKTVNPGDPLSVNGTIRLINTANSANYGQIYDGGGMLLLSANSNPMYFYTGGAERVRITGGGTVQISAGTGGGNATGANDLYVSSDIELDGTLYGSGSDLAEMIDSDGTAIPPGTVVELIPGANTTVRKSTIAYSKTVAGIITTRPSLLIGTENGGVALAISGRVPVKANTENGPIMVGDLLTTSSTPGEAMKCNDMTRCFGAILGKAAEDLTSDRGTITALVVLG